MHTHLSENLKEIEWVKALFPEQKGYLDVYDHFELLGERSVFAHGVHLCDDECQRLAETGSAVAFCPTSNLFLGSGLFNLPQAERFKVNVGLGTDVGAGTSFSLLNTLNEAYKVMQLQARACTRSSRCTWPPSAAPAHCAWTTGSAACARATMPTSWCWTTRPRHCWTTASSSPTASKKPCSCSLPWAMTAPCVKPTPPGAACTSAKVLSPGPDTARRRLQHRSAAPPRTATAAAGPSHRRTRPAPCCARG
jgi:hypothetical protein